MMRSEIDTSNSTYGIGSTDFSRENVSCLPDPASQLHTTVIFQCSVVIIGIIGVLANGLVIWVHYRSRSEDTRRASNSLMLNQLFSDLCSCVFLIVTYVWKLTNVKLEGISNVVLCFFIGSKNLQWTCINSSITNLTFIALERYVKIVHPIWQRNCFRKWITMTYVSIVISWIVGILTNFPSTWISTDFSDGNCEAYVIWSYQDAVWYGIFYVLVSYILPIIILILCYSHIWLAIRGRTKVGTSVYLDKGLKKVAVLNVPFPSTKNEEFAWCSRNLAFGGASNVCQSQAAASTHTRKGGERRINDQTITRTCPRIEQKPKSEHTLLKTMLMITIFFTFSWCPNNVYFILVSVDRSGNFSMTSDMWYASLFIAFLSQCLHPFIYGATTKNVKMYMKHFIRWPALILC